MHLQKHKVISRLAGSRAGVPALHIFHYSTPYVWLMPLIGNYTHSNYGTPGLSARHPPPRRAAGAAEHQRKFLHVIQA